MIYVNVDTDVKIAVEDLNPDGKKTILMVHGWPLSQKIFEYQKNVLPDLGYRVITMDLRGFGKSDTPAFGYSYSDMATDIYMVIKCLGIRNFTLAGFSMGGAIAIRYMSLYHGYGVSKLILIGAAAPSFIRRPGYPYGMTREQVNELINSAYIDRPHMAEEFGKMHFAKPQSQSLKDWFKYISFSASGIGTIQTGRALRDEDLRNELSSICVPTGIFHGKKDAICPLEFANVMREMIPNSKLFAFEDSGHAVFYEALEEFNETLILYTSD